MVRDDRPLVALTMGDVAGVGPEVIARAWSDSPLRTLARPLVVGSAAVLDRALRSLGGGPAIQRINEPEEAQPNALTIPCLDINGADLANVPPGRVSARAGRAAYEFLIAAIDLALAGRVDAITTLSMNKESLHAAGIPHPGHTEILAERCGVTDHAMMLYLGPPVGPADSGLGVIHVTLHVPLRQVFELLTIDAIERKIVMADWALRPLTNGRAPHVAVTGLNPHAGENGLFGDEEIRIIAPA
ncbi:MAG TPA: 4-hydroxythreonine-4-phosphate dehydrogenase PdxA, partial [Isosphaeraceae bacterium]|nr:4-hydroxythreonine-4-phosphate dehydrogenase PdxA [Isosphaeraceae bacterium]